MPVPLADRLRVGLPVRVGEEPRDTVGVIGGVRVAVAVSDALSVGSTCGGEDRKEGRGRRFETLKKKKPTKQYPGEGRPKHPSE